MAARATGTVRDAIVGGEVERTLVSALDTAADTVAQELALSDPDLLPDEIAAAFREQIRSTEVPATPSRTDAGVAELLEAGLRAAFAPWSSVPMYETVTTEQHFGIELGSTIELLVVHTLIGIRTAASGNLEGLASEIRHEELLTSIRSTARDDSGASRGRAQNLSGGDVRLAHFALDTARCTFRSYTYDPSKPRWPAADTGGVTYHGGRVTQYGRTWESDEERRLYGARLRETHNHRAFSRPSDAIVLEVDTSRGEASSDRLDLPVFYVVLANYRPTQIVLMNVGVDVADAAPLAGIPESRALESLVTYEVPAPPIVGRHMRAAIPALRVAPHDAAGFHVRIGFAQSFYTLARVVLDLGDRTVLSPPIGLAY